MSADKREKAYLQRRKRIIQSTMGILFKKGGAASTSTDEICRKARITRPTFYHYFKDKRDLLLAVHLESMEKILKPYLTKAAAIEDPLTRLGYMIRTFTKDVCTHPELKVLIHDTLAKTDKGFNEVKEVWKQHYLLLKDTIVQLQEKGLIAKHIRPSWAALFILGMLTWITYWFDYSRRDKIEGISDLAEELVFHGLGLKG